MDLNSVGAVETAGLQCLSDPAVRTLALDLRNVTFIDSTGIGTLVRLRLAAKEHGKQLVLAEPSPPVLRVLDLTSLTASFEIA
jgi:anti-anti-sigma factor